MKRTIYGESVQGASHVRNGVECQDSFKKVEVSEGIAIIAVADGHGSASCPYSKTGSVVATNVFCKVMKELVNNFADDMEFLGTYLNREGETKVAQAIDAEWKRRIWISHREKKRDKSWKANGKVDKAAVYKQYGTTLVGLLITPKFFFALQIGDGDMLYIDQETIQPVIEADKILGTETHSLSKENAWKKAITCMRMREASEKLPYLFMLSTDGFSNSYASEEEFCKSCRSYYDVIRDNGFEAITENLKDWLDETSQYGCGDDITVVFAYFEEQEDYTLVADD